MAERSPPQCQQDRIFRFENVEIFKNEASQLGVGSYGAVYKARCDQLPCAAKILHPILFQTNDPGSRRILERFEQECGFLNSIRHPNIVQYLGVRRDRDSGLPVLLMELLDSSLTKYLETSNKPLLYHVQVDLCFDIALAIAYLHSNGIIHRDLSGNNVLIVAGSRAKVTDFGMSKLVDASSRITCNALTHCPGTEVYMSPEAVKEPPEYTKKMDCFSFGALVIQTVTRLYPNPGPRRREVPSPLSPAGFIEVPVVDTERRKAHIDKIDPIHPLLPVATECLRYNQEDRPSAQLLCEQLATLKEAPQYSESKQRMQESSSPVENDTTDKSRMIRELQQEVRTKDYVIQEKDRLIQQRDRVIRTKDLAIQEKEHVIHQKNHVIQQRDHVIQTKHLTIQDKERIISDRERILRDMNCQLQDSEHMVAEFQQTLAQRDKEIRDLRENLSTRDSHINDLPRQLLNQQLSVEQPQASNCAGCWRDGGKAPRKMRFGSCVVDGNTAYFRDFATDIVYAHNATTGKWDHLPKCPYTDFALVLVNGLLTAVGGWDSSGNTNKLLSLVGEGGGRKWVEQLPHMPTIRHNTAAVCSGNILVVAGGYSHLGRLKTVELLDTDRQQWFIVSELPYPLSDASATVCGDNLFLIGGFAYGDTNKSVLTCSLEHLVKLVRLATLTLGGRLKNAFSSQTDIVHKLVWGVIASLPVDRSTCTTLNGQLVAVGGWDSDGAGKPTNSVYAYDPETNRWYIISMMPTARSTVLVVVLPGNMLMVVGGFTSFGASGTTDKVEVATF